MQPSEKSVYYYYYYIIIIIIIITIIKAPIPVLVDFNSKNQNK